MAKWANTLQGKWEKSKRKTKPQPKAKTKTAAVAAEEEEEQAAVATNYNYVCGICIGPSTEPRWIIALAHYTNLPT